MADDPHIWVEIDDGYGYENEDQFLRGIDAHEYYMQLRAKRFLDSLANEGVNLLSKNVSSNTDPDYSTGYTLRHVDRTYVELEPGMTEFEATVGILAGESYHPVYVNRGTGEFGPFIKQPYTTKPPGGLMWFHASRIGARIGAYEVRGQKAKHFLYITFAELQVFAQARITSKDFGI